MTDNRNIDEFDELQLFFGDDYVINSKITIHQPTLGEIIEMGERNYFRVVHNLTCIPSDLKSLLWDHKIDWEQISDFDLFCMLAPSMSVDETKILFGESLDFSTMNKYYNKQNDQSILAPPDGSIIIDEYVYLKIVLYLRKLHNIKPKVEHAANKTTKEVMIMLDRQDRQRASSKSYTSTLLPLVSSLLVNPGFKYKKSELKEVGYYEFMDNVRRILAVKNADALTQGIYCGNVNPKKLSNKKALDGFRDLSGEA